MTVQYLIDSENVGDFWIPLLDLPVDQIELIVFYTRNSPHMSYDSLIKLKESDRKVSFIKCFEGTNALDFQLVSELGYRICQNEGGRFVIVTNDTGFDAAVKYWRRRHYSVKRITGKECKNVDRRKKEDLAPDRPMHRIPAQMAAPAAERPAAGAAVRRGGGAASSAAEASFGAAAGASSPESSAAASRRAASASSDGRPSRPNLRDAESARLPEPDEIPFGGGLSEPDEIPFGGVLSEPDEIPFGGGLSEPDELPFVDEEDSFEDLSEEEFFNGTDEELYEFGEDGINDDGFGEEDYEEDDLGGEDLEEGSFDDEEDVSGFDAEAFEENAKWDFPEEDSDSMEEDSYSAEGSAEEDSGSAQDSMGENADLTEETPDSTEEDLDFTEDSPEMDSDSEDKDFPEKDTDSAKGDFPEVDSAGLPFPENEEGEGGAKAAAHGSDGNVMAQGGTTSYSKALSRYENMFAKAWKEELEYLADNEGQMKLPVAEAGSRSSESGSDEIGAASGAGASSAGDASKSEGDGAPEEMREMLEMLRAASDILQDEHVTAATRALDDALNGEGSAFARQQAAAGGVFSEKQEPEEPAGSNGEGVAESGSAGAAFTERAEDGRPLHGGEPDTDFSLFFPPGWGDEGDESLFSDEDADGGSETSRKSKSRRSRSRRSRNGSKKQDQGSSAEAHERQEAGRAPSDDDAASSDAQDGAPAELPPPGDEEIARVAACIGADNLAELHNQLATLYGDQGKEIYSSIKSNARSIPDLKPDLGQKFEWYCGIIFGRAGQGEECPADLPAFLLGAREKLNSLNSLRYALQKQYGKDKGRKYYFLLKPYAKAMYQM